MSWRRQDHSDTEAGRGLVTWKGALSAMFPGRLSPSVSWPVPGLLPSTAESTSQAQVSRSVRHPHVTAWHLCSQAAPHTCSTVQVPQVAGAEPFATSTPRALRVCTDPQPGLVCVLSPTDPSARPFSDGHAAETSGSCQLHRVSRSRNHPGPQPPGHALRGQEPPSP